MHSDQRCDSAGTEATSLQRERRLRHFSGIDNDVSLVDWTEEAGTASLCRD